MRNIDERELGQIAGGSGVIVAPINNTEIGTGGRGGRPSAPEPGDPNLPDIFKADAESSGAVDVSAG